MNECRHSARRRPLGGPGPGRGQGGFSWGAVIQIRSTKGIGVIKTMRGRNDVPGRGSRICKGLILGRSKESIRDEGRPLYWWTEELAKSKTEQAEADPEGSSGHFKELYSIERNGKTLKFCKPRATLHIIRPEPAAHPEKESIAFWAAHYNPGRADRPFYFGGKTYILPENIPTPCSQTWNLFHAILILLRWHTITRNVAWSRAERLAFSDRYSLNLSCARDWEQAYCQASCFTSSYVQGSSTLGPEMVPCSK